MAHLSLITASLFLIFRAYAEENVENSSSTMRIPLLGSQTTVEPSEGERTKETETNSVISRSTASLLSGSSSGHSWTSDSSTTEDTFVFKNVFELHRNEESTTDLNKDVSTENINNKTNETVKMMTLSDQIRAVVKHYSTHKTVILPNSSTTFPDPMTVPDIEKNMGGMKVKFTNNKVYGLSNFTIQHINTDLDNMQVFVAIFVKRLLIIGNYTASSFFTRKMAGPYDVMLMDVEASGAAALVRDEDGYYQASESEMDMTFFDSKVRFSNLGIMGSMLEGVLSHAGPVLFESIKPIIILEVNGKLRKDINVKLKTIGSKMTSTNSTPPLDLAFQKCREYLVQNGFDPFYIKNYTITQNGTIFTLNITQLILTGLSKFRRVGEVSLSMDSGTVQFGIHLATSKLKGNCKWDVKIGQTFRRLGITNFTVDYVQVKVFVNQSLDIKETPVLEDIDINLGKLKIHMRGIDPLDFMIESVVNTLPDLLRHLIVDAIEIPLKIAIQLMLNQIDVEEILEKSLPKLDEMGL